MTTRRSFLGSLVAAAALPRLGWADAGSPTFLSAAQEPDGGHALFGLSADGQDLFRVPLPARGHAATAHPEAPEAVAFARRPGTYALVLNCVTGAVIARLAAAAGREFNGHGVYSMGGDVLYTSEVVADTGEGRIALWSRSDGYARVGEIASGGIGPHEIRRLPGSETLVVANGGIRTGPGDREKLNLDTMAPNLTYLAPDGTIDEQVRLSPGMHKASIRHLSLDAMGRVAFAMQWEGPMDLSPALLGLHQQGDHAPMLVRAPDNSHAAMQGYAGSVTFFEDGRKVAISSPKGGRVQVFDAQGQYAYEVLRADVCGLAADGDLLAMTDGHGAFVLMRDRVPAGHSRANRAWDNHIVRL
ncbi:DUF1513 domain-containing protein [Defluviimonas sp. WL0002]|uniref:DUF1513 domain-containing protein n=1 Tax=Albidovulum marisflavi TaxID=2984159 RepID=A0ABT2ZCQ6_9RHOB|nr:DUF1513 domain-containing protein [Defluviimonas sp. WL0002]MCV2868928.1 DUF1513 domain-containing protein [Defluviimonas sp. WL0002]